MSGICKKIIPVFYATDDVYAPMLAVSIRSLLDNADNNYFYNIHVLTSSMGDENREIISSLAGKNSKIFFNDASDRLDRISDSLSVRDYYSIATYYRLFIANMFPEYDKAIYIDSDTVVSGDISKMFATDMGACLVGAVHDNVMFISVFGDYVEKVLTVKREKYFNAGILLMDLAKFRSEDIEGAFLKLLSERKFPVAQDQDYLNILCRDRVYYLGYEWNLAPVEEMAGIKPSIIHFKMALRPWNYDGIMHGELFWKYAKNTPFYDILRRIKENHSELDTQTDKDVGDGLVRLAIEEIAKAEKG